MTQSLNTIVHGDCLDVLPGLPEASVSFILTDPPYLVSYKPFKSNAGQKVLTRISHRWFEPLPKMGWRAWPATDFLPNFGRIALWQLGLASFDSRQNRRPASRRQ